MTVTKYPEWKCFKVVKIYRVWTHTKKGALESVRKDGGEVFLEVEFAKEETPKGILGMILKQILG